MHNIELRLLDLESFNGIVQTLVQECDIFEGCLLENDQNSTAQEIDSLQDIPGSLSEPLSECFREESCSKVESSSSKSNVETIIEFDRDGNLGVVVVRRGHNQESRSQINMSSIRFEKAHDFSQFMRELKNLSNELAKSKNDNIRYANNEIRAAIQEGESQQPNGLSILEKLYNAWKIVDGLGDVGAVISTAVTVLTMMLRGIPK